MEDSNKTGKTLVRVTALVLLCMAAPVIWAQSYDEIRTSIFEATNQWRQDNSGEISGTVTLVRDRIIDGIIQAHVEDKAGCGFFFGGDPHNACNGDDFSARLASGGGTQSENLLTGRIVPRDTLLEDLGISESDLNLNQLERQRLASSQLNCLADRHSNLIVQRPAAAGSGSATIPVCTINGDPAFEGTVDAWARSPGHRANMIGGHSTIGIGYTEGITNSGTCADQSRDANGRIINREGCTTGSISGQMFSSIAHGEAGFLSVATQSSVGYFLPADSGGGTGGTGGGTGGTGGGTGGTGGGTGGTGGGTGGTGGGTGGTGTGTGTGDGGMMVVTTTTSRQRPITNNMRATDRALANLYTIYQIGNDLTNGGDEQALLTEAASAGYGDLDAAQIRGLPENEMLDQFFQNMALMSLQGMRGNEEVLQALEETVREISSESYAAVSENAVHLGLATDRILRHRLALKRINNHNSLQSVSKETRIAATQTGAELSNLLGIEQVMAAHLHDDASSNVWVRTYGRYSDQDRDEDLAQHDTRDHGIIAGVEIPLADGSVQVGAYAGAGLSDTDYDGNLADDESRYYQVGLYGSASTPDDTYYVQGAVGLSYMQHEHSRSPQLGSTNPGTPIKADYDSWMIFASGGGGAVFNINQLVLQPEATVSYYYHDIEAIRENGNSGLRLAIGERTEKTITTRVGMLAGKQFHIFGDKELLLKGGLNYLFLHASNRDHQARLAIVPGSGNGFAIQGRGHRHYYEHEVGFVLAARDLVELSGEYRLLADSSSTHYSFNLGLRYQF